MAFRIPRNYFWDIPYNFWVSSSSMQSLRALCNSKNPQTGLQATQETCCRSLQSCWKLHKRRARPYMLKPSQKRFQLTLCSQSSSSSATSSWSPAINHPWWLINNAHPTVPSRPSWFHVKDLKDKKNFKRILRTWYVISLKKTKE